MDKDQLLKPLRGFGRWKDRRPFWGGVLLIAGSMVVAYVPFNMASALFIGNSVAVIGLLFAALMFMSGSFVLLRPDLHDILGIAGAFFSISSVFGALGGFGLGLFLGLLGGSLSYAWIPPDERPTEGKSYKDASDVQKEVKTKQKDLKDRIT